MTWLVVIRVLAALTASRSAALRTMETPAIFIVALLLKGRDGLILDELRRQRVSAFAGRGSERR